jgi:predicted nucleotide-binding protein
VFIVHGHDDHTREATARFISKLGLEPIILHERANQGKTIIEKLEANADVAFAVVLLTPDDEGHAVGKPDNLQPRARQNVVLELGYFMGALRRHRVCALHKGNLELPSDVDGVVYVPMDDGDAWHLKLAKEMKVAGLDVDLNKII